MNDPAFVKLLASGFLGAFIAAVLNHFYRRYEAHLDRSRNQRHAAYVYITKLARIVAGAEIASLYSAQFKPVFELGIKETEKDHGEKFEIAELVCAAIFSSIKDKLAGNALASELQSAVELVQLYDENFDEYFDFHLSIDQQAKLPIEVIVQYTIFSQALIEAKMGFIPTFIDQNPCAQSRSPMDMMRHGCSTSLFQAAQQ